MVCWFTPTSWVEHTAQNTLCSKINPFHSFCFWCWFWWFAIWGLGEPGFGDLVPVFLKINPLAAFGETVFSDLVFAPSAVTALRLKIKYRQKIRWLGFGIVLKSKWHQADPNPNWLLHFSNQQHDKRIKFLTSYFESPNQRKIPISEPIKLLNCTQRSFRITPIWWVVCVYFLHEETQREIFWAGISILSGFFMDRGKCKFKFSSYQKFYRLVRHSLHIILVEIT